MPLLNPIERPLDLVSPQLPVTLPTILQALSADALGQYIAKYTSQHYIFISTDVRLPSSWYSKGLCELCPHLPVQFVMM